jgi:soluble lytic murein transglycosylase-like protein
MANFNVNFELIGNAGSLVQALQLAASELQRTGTVVQGTSAQIASTMTTIFGQGLVEITKKAEAANARLSQIRQKNEAEIARINNSLYKTGPKGQQLALPVQDLIAQLNDPANAEIARRVQQKFGTNQVQHGNITQFRKAVKDAVADYERELENQVAQLPDNQLVEHYQRMAKRYERYLKSDIIGALGGKRRVFRPDDFIQLPQPRDVDAYIRSVQQQILARAANLAAKPPGSFSSENALRGRRKELTGFLRLIEDDIRKARASLQGLDSRSVQFRFLTGLVRHLQQQRARINNEVRAVGNELTSFGKAALTALQTSNADFLRSRAGGLQGRGVTADTLNPLGKGLARLRVDRRNLRLVLAQIEEDIREARERIARGDASRAEKTGLNSLVKNLQEQRLQVRNAVSGITDELGNVATRTPFARFVDYFKFGVLAGGFYTVTRSVQALTRSVIEASGEFQALRTSFVAVLAEPILAADRDRTLTPELFNSLAISSEQIFRNAQIAAIKTVATTKEYVTTLQSALAVGQNVGLSQGEIEKLTLSATVAAGAFGIEMEKVGSSLAQIFTGSVRVTNQLARNLGLATTEQRKALKDAIDQNRLFEFLNARLKAFEGVSEKVANNFKNVVASLTDIVEFGGSEAIRPLFDFLNQALIRIRDTFIGDSPARIFKAPLLTLIDVVRSSIIRLLPSLAELTKQIGITARQFGLSLAGPGVKAIETILKLLTAVVQTFNELVGGGKGFTSTLISYVPHLVAFRAITSVLVGQTGGLYAAWVRVTEQIQVAANFAKNYSGVTSLTSPGLTAAPQTRRQAGFVVSTSQVQQQNAAVGAATRGWGGFRNAVINVGTALGGVATAFGTAGLAIAGVVTVIGLASNLWDEYSGKAREARLEQEKFSESLAESQQRLSEQIQQAQVLENILALQEAAKAANSGAGIKQLQESRAIVSTIFSELQTLQLETGNLSQQQLDEVLARYKQIGSVFARYAADAKEVANTSFDTLQQAQRRFKEFKTAYDAQLDNLRLGGADAAPAIDALNKRLAEERALLAQAERATRGFAASQRVSGDEAVQTREKYEELQKQAAKISEEYTRISETSERATLDPLAAIDRLAAAEAEVDRLAKQRDALLPQLLSGDAAAYKEYEDNLKRVQVLQSVAVSSEQALVSRIKLLGEEQRKELIRQIKIRNDEIQIVEGSQRARFIEAEQRATEIRAIRNQAIAHGQLVRALSLNLELREKEKNSFDAKKRLEELERIRAAGEKILRDLGEGPKREDQDEEKKVSKGRDPLNDFISQLTDEVQVTRELSEQVAENVRQVNDRRREILKTLQDQGAITSDAFFRASRATLESEFELTRRFMERQVEFINAQEASARALGLRAQSAADQAEEYAEASGKKQILNPDDRKRELEAFLKITKLQLDAEKELLKRRQDFEKALTDLVREHVDRRLDERRRELDQVPALLKIFADAEGRLDEQLAQLNEISPREQVEREFARRRAASDSDRLRLVQDIFPLADPVTRNQVLAAIEAFASEVKRATTAAGTPFSDVADDVEMLRDKLSKDLPTSFEEAAESIADIRGQALEILRSLADNSATSLFSKEFEKLNALYDELIKKDAAYARVAEAGGEEANRLAEERARLTDALVTRNAVILEQAKSLSAEERASIEARVRLSQLFAKTFFVSHEKALDAEQKLAASQAERQETENAYALETRRLALAELDTKVKLIDVEEARLKLVTEITEKQRELGVITEDRYEREKRAIIEAQLEAVRLRREALEAQLATSYAPIGGVGNLQNAQPEAVEQTIQLTQSLNDLNRAEQDLRLESEKLESSFDNIAGGFAKLSDAFEQFQDTTDSVGNTVSRAALRALGPVFRSLEGLFNVLDRNRQRQAAATIINAPERFAKVLERQGSAFQGNVLRSSDGLKRSMAETAALLSTVIAQSGTNFASSTNNAAFNFYSQVFKAAEEIRTAGRDFATSVRPPTAPTGAPDAAPGGPVSSLGRLSTGRGGLDALIIEYANKYGIDPRLIAAMIRQESGGKIGAISPKNAQGILQVIPGTFARFRDKSLPNDPFNAEANIAAGVRYMKFLIDRFNGNLELALAGYNAGEGAVERYGRRIPPFRETQQYVPAILGNYQRAVRSGVGVDPFSQPIGKNAQEVAQRVLPILTSSLGDKLIQLVNTSVPGTDLKPIVGDLVVSTAEAVADKVKSATTGGGVASAASGAKSTEIKRSFGTVVSTVMDAAAQVISGFAQGGAGGIISGIGGGISSIGGLFEGALGTALPVVGQILGVVGGIFSFIGAKARQNAEKIAKEVEAGIDKLKQAFSEGKISLSEAIAGINQQVADARAKLSGGKTGKKGGKAALAQIEQNAQAAIQELRDQALEIQTEFLESLKILRQPAELRDIIQQINDARKKAEEFLRSFDGTGDLAQATADAMEFFRLTIKDIRDDIEKTLKDLRKQLKENLEEFERQKNDILTAGRIDPGISEALNKQRQLIDLERQFRERQSELQDQLAAEQKKLDFVNKRAEIEREIARYVERSAQALSNAADRLAQVVGGIGSGIRPPGFAPGGGGGFYNITVNVGGSNATPDQIGVAVARHLRLAGRTSHGHTDRFQT